MSNIPEIEIIKVEKNQNFKKKKDYTVNYWWECQENDDTHTYIFEQCTQIIRQSSKQLQDMITSAMMYENRDVLYAQVNYMFNNFFDISFNDTMANSKLTFNGIKSAIDTLVAKIGSSTPTIRFLTSGGDYNTQLKAEQLTKIMDGTFESTNFSSIAPMIQRDSCIFGTGCAKVYSDDEEIKIDRVIFPLEIVIDRNAARYGNPQDLFYRKLYSKSALKAQFPEYEKEIENCATINTGKGLISDQVEVIEAYHLPFKKHTPGRKCIAIRTALLYDELYEKCYFPFLFLNYSDKLQDFSGSSLVQELLPLQIALTKTYDIIDVGQELNLIPRIVAEAGSIENKNSLWDVGLIEVSPTAQRLPQVFSNPATTGDVYQYQSTLQENMYHLSGVSQLSAGSKKPGGLNSGIAMQTYQDIETERFSIQAKRYSQMHVTAAKMFVDLYRDIYKDKKELKLKAYGGKTNKYIETINWAECDLQENEYIIQPYPVSKLPKSPEGRLDLLSTMAESGLIPREVFLKLMEMPDLEDFLSLENATINLTNKHIYNMLVKKQQEYPIPQMNLEQAKAIVQMEYVKAVNNDTDPSLLELLNSYMEQCVDLLTEQQPSSQEELPPENIPPPPQDQLVPPSPEEMPIDPNQLI